MLGDRLCSSRVGPDGKQVYPGPKTRVVHGATEAIREDSPTPASLGPEEEEIASTQEEPSLPTPRASVWAEGSMAIFLATLNPHERLVPISGGT